MHDFFLLSVSNMVLCPVNLARDINDVIIFHLVYIIEVHEKINWEKKININIKSYQFFISNVSAWDVWMIFRKNEIHDVCNMLHVLCCFCKYVVILINHIHVHHIKVVLWKRRFKFSFIGSPYLFIFIILHVCIFLE